MARFFCCFDLQTGAIFSGVYVLVLSCVFLTKHAVWLRLLLVGQIHDNLEAFIDTLLRDRNDSSWNPTALNLTAELHRRNIASHTLHLLWSSGGIVASIILLVAVCKKLPLLFLPWLSWSSVNSVILLVNAVVDVLIWSYFRHYSSMNAFTVYGYANLPLMLYLLFVTASYYQTLESIYENNRMRCCCPRPCQRLWRKVPSSEVCPGAPAWYQSTNDEPAAGSNRNGSGEQRRLMGNGVDDESFAIEIGECKRPPSPKGVKKSREAKGAKKKFKPPKIRVSRPSLDDDW